MQTPDQTTLSSALVTAASLTLGWLDEHHAAVSVLVAVVSGTVAVISGIYSIRIKINELKKINSR